jgi:16S rRNA (cytidine1402-2'-O)-methyltransferase
MKEAETERRDTGGCLYVVGTPIGNLEDLTDRARRVLAEVDLIAAEDTRTAGRLLQRLGVKARLVSLFEGNEHARAPHLVERLLGGATVALISECGTPAISDPGGILVAASVEAGIDVVPVPGPSAVTAVLSASGLAVDRFRFEGFLPRRGLARRRRIDELKRDDVAAVIYESPHRLAQTLKELAGRLGARRALVAREVTKMHEELVRGTLPELAERYDGQTVKGELVLVIEGRAEGEGVALADDEIEELMRARLAAGESARDVARDLAQQTGRSRRELYALAIRLRG